MLPIVDTHQHMWDLAQFALPWLEGEGMEPLRKNHLMSDYLAAAEGAGIARTVYMEVDVAAAQRIAEAEFVAGLCRADDNPMAAAVIGGSPGEEGFRAYIDRFKGNDFIKGMRLVLHVPDAEPGRCLQESFVRDVQYLGEIGMSFDLCLRPSELGTRSAWWISARIRSLSSITAATPTRRSSTARLSTIRPTPLATPKSNGSATWPHWAHEST